MNVQTDEQATAGVPPPIASFVAQDAVYRLRTRLPAGLTEAELETGYQRPASDA